MSAALSLEKMQVSAIWRDRHQLSKTVGTHHSVGMALGSWTMPHTKDCLAGDLYIHVSVRSELSNPVQTDYKHDLQMRQ